MPVYTEQATAPVPFRRRGDTSRTRIVGTISDPRPPSFLLALRQRATVRIHPAP